MRKQKLWGYEIGVLLLLVAAIAVGSVNVVGAETSSSTHYKMTDTEFSATSNQLNCSASYCAKASIGDMSADPGKSPSYTAAFGTIAADSEPLLEVIVDPGVSELGTLTTERTAFKTATVRVRNYLSSGYTLQVTGNPPQYAGHTLSTPTSPTSSQMGTEQFGVNAVANTLPGVGTDPAQVPSNQTSFGVVSDNYKIPNKFKYASGDEVARSNSSSGRTDYTLSFIVNVSNSTPAGHYSGDFSIIVTPVY